MRTRQALHNNCEHSISTSGQHDSISMAAVRGHVDRFGLRRDQNELPSRRVYPVKWGLQLQPRQAPSPD
jgi:hypothetical protein